MMQLFEVCGERLLTICRMPFLARLNFESLQTCSALRSGSFRHPRGTSPFRRISGRRRRESNQWTMAAAGAADKWRRRGLAVGHSQRRPWTGFLFSHRRCSHAVSSQRRHHRRDERGSVVAGTKGVDEARKKKKRCQPDREERTEARGWAGLAPRSVRA